MPNGVDDWMVLCSFFIKELSSIFVAKNTMDYSEYVKEVITVTSPVPNLYEFSAWENNPRRILESIESSWNNSVIEVHTLEKENVNVRERVRGLSSKHLRYTVKIYGSYSLLTIEQYFETFLGVSIILCQTDLKIICYLKTFRICELWFFMRLWSSTWLLNPDWKL